MTRPSLWREGSERPECGDWCAGRERLRAGRVVRVALIALVLLLVACDAGVVDPSGSVTVPSTAIPSGCRGGGRFACPEPPPPTPVFPDPDSVTFHPREITAPLGDSVAFRIVIWWEGTPYACAGPQARIPVVLGDRNGAWDVIGEAGPGEAWPCDFALVADDPEVVLVEERLTVTDLLTDFAAVVGSRLAAAGAWLRGLFA